MEEEVEAEEAVTVEGAEVEGEDMAVEEAVVAMDGEADTAAKAVPARVEGRQQTDAVGFNLALDLTRHLALVPEVRAHAFSLNGGGPSAFVLRPGLAVRWTF